MLPQMQHNIGKTEPSNAERCAGCNEPILDKFLLNVLDRVWHTRCVRCAHCHLKLSDKCFIRQSQFYCRDHFFELFGTKCYGCDKGIAPSDFIRKANDKVFHLSCLKCCQCNNLLSTGEELYVLGRNKFMCKNDFMTQQAISDYMTGSGSEDDDDDDMNMSKSELRALHLNRPDSVGPLGNSEQSLSTDSKTTHDDSDQGSMDGDPDCRGDSQAENKSPDDGANGSKRRGPRTTIKAKQLDVLKTAFNQTPKPTRHIRESLAKETGLPMRVIQVWFQNKRSKERRLKQLTSMNRNGQFFHNNRKLRSFINLSGGIDDGSPFSFYPDGKFEFPYGPQFHHPHDGPFFPGHPGGPGLPFNPQVGPMDHGIPMGHDFGSLTPEPNFMNQPPGVGGSCGGLNGPGPGGMLNGLVGGPDHLLNGPGRGGPGGGIGVGLGSGGGGGGGGGGGIGGGGGPGGGSGGSPEYMNSGNFSDTQSMQSEGLVW